MSQDYSLTIVHLYPHLLNLYGDRGNVECLVRRCEWRDITVKVVPVGPGTTLPSKVDLVTAGGGADVGQTLVVRDLPAKKVWLNELAHSGVVGLFVCGAYQLLGQYYQAADGSRLEGVGIFDVYTQHFGKEKPRCVGNVVVRYNSGLLEKLRDSPRKRTIPSFPSLVGFENHGGRTYLGEGAKPLGKVIKGCGNNGEDKTEGIVFNNFLGTYLHGPVLAKNPVFADHLIQLALKNKYGEEMELPRLEDALEQRSYQDVLHAKR